MKNAACKQKKCKRSDEEYEPVVQVIAPKNPKLTKEQVNVILRRRKRLVTFTVEEINDDVKKLQDDLSYIADLETLMNSIKTHKAYEPLKALLAYPRPDVNEAARACAKIKVFKQGAERLNLVKQNPLTTTESV